MIAQIEKPNAPTNATDEVLALQSLEASMGWAVMVRILKENITYLEQLILNKVDPLTNIILSEIDVDKLRYKREISKEFLDTPKNYIKMLTPKEEIETTDPDPYYKNANEILKDNLGKSR